MFNEEAFTRDLDTVLTKYEDKTSFLFDVNSRLTISVNVAIIAHMLGRGSKGINICIDIPHTYIKRPLLNKQANIDGITFLDLISNITTEPKDETGNVRYLDNFFCLELIYEALLDQTGFDFMLIDNLSNMLAFFREAEINDFLMNLFDFATRHPTLKIFIIVDSKSERIYRLLDPMVQIKLNMHHM